MLFTVLALWYVVSLSLIFGITKLHCADGIAVPPSDTAVNSVVFLWCNEDSEDLRNSSGWSVSEVWEVPEAIVGDKTFNVTLTAGQIRCQVGEIVEVTLDLNTTEEKPSEYFLSRGYFRYNKEFHHVKEFCISEITDSLVIVKVCETVTCGSENPCVPKCCPLHKLMTPTIDANGKIRNTCGGPYEDTLNFAPVLYEAPFSKMKLVDDRQHHIHHRRPLCPNGSHTILPHSTNQAAIDYYKRPGLCYRIRPDGKMMYRDRNYAWVEVDSEDYCLDGFYLGPNRSIFNADEGKYGVVMCALPPTNDSDSRLHSFIVGITLLSSSGFLLATCLTYLLLWNQNSTSGLTTICHSSSLFFMYVSIGVAHLLRVHPDTSFTETNFCEALGISAHFFFLASFFWLTVINFQLFRTFFRQQTPSRSRGTKFWRYLLFGWGAPGAIVMMSVIVDHVYRSGPCLTFPVPLYGLLRKCYMDTAAMGLYMYYPVGCLLATNVVLFFTTAYKLYECQQSTKFARENLNQSQQMFKVILRLFFVMGVTWIFEFISWCDVRDQKRWYWLAFDIANCLQAVAIFVIYVCKPEVMRSLMRNYPTIKPCLNAVLRCFRVAPHRRIDRAATYTTSLRFSKSSSVRSNYGKGQTNSLTIPLNVRDSRADTLVKS